MINTNPALNQNRATGSQSLSALTRQPESQSQNFSQQAGTGIQNSPTLSSLVQLLIQLLRQFEEQPQPQPAPQPQPVPEPTPPSQPITPPEVKPLNLTPEQREAIQDRFGIFGEQGFSVADKDKNGQLSAGDVISVSGGITGGPIREITVTEADVSAISGKDLADAKADFLENKAKWENTRPDNYSYTLERSGFITPDARQPVDITVNGDQVVKAEGAGGSDVPEFNKLSVDDLFDRIEQGINSGAAEVRVEYDPQTGVPTSIFIDQDRRIADEELSLSASNFKNLDTPPNPDDITGTDGDDILNGTAKDERISGLAGNDRILGRQGNDFLFGNEGNDSLYGGRGDDTLSGGAGNDYLSGSTGNNRLFGGAGDDTLASRLGSDFLDGGSGDDTARIRGNIDDYSINVATIFPQPINPGDPVALGAPADNGFTLTNNKTGQTISAVNIENFTFNDVRLSADELRERIDGPTEPAELNLTKEQQNAIGGRFNNTPPPNLADGITTKYTGVAIDNNGDGKLSVGDTVKIRDSGGLLGLDRVRDHVLTAEDIADIETDRSNPLLDISNGLSDEQSQRLIDAIFPDQAGLIISDETITLSGIFDHNSDGKLSVGDGIQIQRNNGEAPEGFGVSLDFHTLTQDELDRYLTGSVAT